MFEYIWNAQYPNMTVPGLSKMGPKWPNFSKTQICRKTEFVKNRNVKKPKFQKTEMSKTELIILTSNNRNDGCKNCLFIKLLLSHIVSVLVNPAI